MNENVEYLTI